MNARTTKAIRIPAGFAVFAIDPGGEAGAALVMPRPLNGIFSQKPVLLGAWRVHGGTRRSWLTRARAAVEEAGSLAPQGFITVVEQSPPTRRKRKGAAGAGGDKSGIRTAEGMGRWGGYLQALAWAQSPKHEPQLVEQTDWTRGLRIRRSKNDADGGAHRLREAGTILDLGDLELPSVDAAEAALIGAYVALRAVAR
jgi:hypothetical protein